MNLAILTGRVKTRVKKHTTETNKKNFWSFTISCYRYQKWNEKPQTDDFEIVTFYEPKVIHPINTPLLIEGNLGIHYTFEIDTIFISASRISSFAKLNCSNVVRSPALNKVVLLGYITSRPIVEYFSRIRGNLVYVFWLSIFKPSMDRNTYIKVKLTKAPRCFFTNGDRVVVEGILSILKEEKCPIVYARQIQVVDKSKIKPYDLEPEWEIIDEARSF